MTSPSSVLLDCGYDDGPHEFPVDWIFGGGDGHDPKADPRYQPTTYQYYDDQLRVIHIAQEYICDEEAIDAFTQVASFGKTFNPVHISVRRPGEDKFRRLPVKYDKATDMAEDT